MNDVPHYPGSAPAVVRQFIRPNVLILTSGLTGSSVLAGLIARQNYWLGVDTFKKEYDTFENIDLIRLNKRLIAEVGFTGRYTMDFFQEPIDQIAALDPAQNGAPYREFLAECNRHEPWIWKDPRLWLTIRYWSQMLDWSRCKVILLTRDLRRHWVSMTLRRQIQSYAAMRSYEASIERSLLQFADSRGIETLRLNYDDLIVRPEKTIELINGHIGSQLAVADLKAIYRGKLYKAPRNSVKDLLTAFVIYAKNRAERWDLNESRRGFPNSIQMQRVLDRQRGLFNTNLGEGEGDG